MGWLWPRFRLDLGRYYPGGVRSNPYGGGKLNVESAASGSTQAPQPLFGRLHPNDHICVKNYSNINSLVFSVTIIMVKQSPFCCKTCGLKE